MKITIEDITPEEAGKLFRAQAKPLIIAAEPQMVESLREGFDWQIKTESSDRIAERLQGEFNGLIEAKEAILKFHTEEDQLSEIKDRQREIKKELLGLNIEITETQND